MQVTILYIFLISILTLSIGMFSGTILSVISKGKKNNFQGFAPGFIVGIMVAILVLELLPQAFAKAPLAVVILGIIIGFLGGIASDNIFEYINERIRKQRSNTAVKTAILFSSALSMHNLIEGVALGALLATSFNSSLVFGAALCVDNIIDGTAITVPIRQSKFRVSYFLHQVLLSIILSIFIVAGVTIGTFINKIPDIAVSATLGFIAGFIIYIIIGEMHPKKTAVTAKKSYYIFKILGCLIGFFIIFIMK